MSQGSDSRRNFLKNAALVTGSAILLNSCGGNAPNAVNTQKTAKKEAKKEPEEKEVTAAEDLMREHGILRRALIVYSESAVRLRKKAADVAPDALQKTARLFRSFGEDYHEKQLEEAFIFPAVKKKGGEAAALADILIAQHTRGREITDYIISQTNGAKLGANAAALADLFDKFVRMYETHAAREDTIVFPAWKDAISDDEYLELSDKFEDIEHQTFGEDGFETAVKQIAEIEAALKLSDIAQFTAPAPPSPVQSPDPRKALL